MLPQIGNNAAIAAVAATAKKNGLGSTLRHLSPLEIMDDREHKVKHFKIEESPSSSAHQTSFGKINRPSTPVKALISNTYGKMSERVFKERAEI